PPRFLGSFQRDGWHVLLLEDLGPRTMPPWTPAKARRAARSYARFHRTTLGRPLPRWLSRTQHHGFGSFWHQLAESNELPRAAALAKRRAREAEEWLDVALPLLREQEGRVPRIQPPFALLQFDTRSDHARIAPGGRRCRAFRAFAPSSGASSRPRSPGPPDDSACQSRAGSRRWAISARVPRPRGEIATNLPRRSGGVLTSLN